MVNDAALDFILAFAILLIGLMFLEGTWAGKGSILKSIVNVDNLFFSTIKDRRLLKVADQFTFMVCLLMAVLTLINGILLLFFGALPNVTAIFLFVAVVLSWPIRIAFILANKSRDYRDVPRIWPFSKTP